MAVLHCFDAKNTANLFPIGQLIVLIVDNPQFAAPPRVDAHYCFVQIGRAHV